MFDLFSLRTGDKIKLSDPEIGYPYGTYTYYNEKNEKNENHVFVPDDPIRETIHRSNLGDIIRYYHPFSTSDDIEYHMKCTECTECKDKECSHYLYNAYLYHDIIRIIPVEKIQPGHFSISETRLKTIYDAVILPPIHVIYQAEKDIYHIQNGNHRYIYSLQKGYKMIPCIF